jgi:hypothetical protein
MKDLIEQFKPLEGLLKDKNLYNFKGKELQSIYTVMMRGIMYSVSFCIIEGS